MPDTLFISYKSEENPFALQLAAGLKNHGVNVWIDRMDIQPGEEWDAAIGAALRNCSGMIAILTPDYFRSHVCLDELHFAYANDRPILPLLLRNIFDERDHDVQAKIPFWLPRRQWLDFGDFLDDAAFQRQFDILLTRIQAEQQGVVGDRPSPEIQYLTSLIADLESQQGVENYIALSAQSEVVRVDPRPRKNIEPSLALLLKPPTPERDVRPATKKIDNIQQAVADHPKFVLIGDPGAGKTTTLRRLALEMARTRLEELTSPPGPLSNRRGGEMPLPFLVYLPRWSAEATAADFIRRQWATTNMGGDVVRELQSGQVRLYLDGLNEMGGEGKNRAALLREWLQAANGPRYAVITCRQGDYHDDLDLKLPTVLVEPLTDEKIRELAVQYLGEERAGRFLEKVFPQYESHDSIPERKRKYERSLLHLARTPFLLAALTIIVARGDALPRNIGTLLQQLVIILWEREGLRQTSGWIPYEEMQAAFGDLAFGMIDEDKPIDVSLNYAETKLGNADLLNIGRSAFLITLNGTDMRFSHQLMLEYFAAIGLLKAGLATRLLRPTFDVFSNRSTTKWDRVVITSCGLVSDASTVINQAVGIDPFLAADCLRSGIEVTPATHEKVVTSLSEALRDADRYVHYAASKALGNIGTPAVPALLDALHESDSGVRYRAVDALGRIGDPATIPALVDALHDAQYLVRYRAAYGLGRIGGPTGIPALAQALQDAEKVVRSGAVRALGTIGTPAVPALAEALYNADSLVRYLAAEALYDIGNPAAVPALSEALRDTDSGVREKATQALAHIGTSTAIPALAEALRDTDSGVRYTAVGALGRIGNPAAIPALLDALHDADSRMRSAAAQALGSIGDPAAVPALIERLVDTNKASFSKSRVCDDAVAALEKIGTPEALEAVRRWREDEFARACTNLQDANISTRIDAILTLAETADPRAIPYLIVKLADTEVGFWNQRVYDYAAQALEKIGTPEALEAARRWRKEQGER